MKEKPTQVEFCGHTLYEGLAKALTQNGRIRAEDLLSAAAAIVGEAIIGAAGEFNPRSHQYPPGSRVLSHKVNILFCGDENLANAPSTSVTGILFAELIKCGFVQEDFPALKDIFTFFVASVGKPEDWGKAPLSIPKENQPFTLPLRITYDTRKSVDLILTPLGDDQQQKLQAATLALVEALCKTRDVLNRRIAITLALETINGMAKTAPMTEAAMATIMAQKKT